MEHAILVSTGLQFQYPNGKEMRFPDIQLKAHDAMLLLGPSGCGKSTYLHMCSGLVRKYNGKISIASQALEELSDKALDVFRAKHIGIVLQDSIFIHSLTVLENLMLFQQLASGQINRKNCQELLLKLGLEKYANKKTYELSGGERQRLSLARALVHKPKLILADEPTSALDDGHAYSIAKLLKELSDETGAALLIATHDARLRQIFTNQTLL